MIGTLIKLMKRQPLPPCQYCAKSCKDDNTSYCSEFASAAKLKHSRGLFR